MKKLITLLLALAMVLSLTACGEQPTGATGDDGNTVSAESDGRTLYEAAIQLACDGDFPGSIEGLKKAVAAEETDTWNEMDIDLAYKRMAQLYLLLGDTEGQAQANADCLAARGWEPLGLDDLYFEGNCDLDQYFDASPFGNWGNNVLIYDLEGEDGLALFSAFPERLKRWVTMHSFNGRMSVGVQICTPWSAPPHLTARLWTATSRPIPRAFLSNRPL